MQKNTAEAHLTPKGQQTRQRILDNAITLFAEKGYERTTMRDIADAAGCSLGLTYRYFSQKEELAAALYFRLAADVLAQVDTLERGSIAQRFYAAMQAWITRLTAYRGAVAAVIASAVQGTSSRGITQAGFSADPMHDVLREVVQRATDRPNDTLSTSLTTVLYALYVLLLFFWLLDRTPYQQATQSMLGFARRMLQTGRPMLIMPVFSGAVHQMALILDRVLIGVPTINGTAGAEASPDESSVFNTPDAPDG